MKYVNTDALARVWPNLTHPDGHTLGLESGEAVELEAGIDDPYLRPAEPASDLQSLKRGALNDLAAQAGVTDPHLLANKQAVIDAISAAAPGDPADAETTSEPGETPDENPAPQADTPDPAEPAGTAAKEE